MTKTSAPIIFISYARKDSANVKELYAKLSLSGYVPWMDIQDIVAGEDWEKKILSTIKQAPIFLACLSEHSVDRRGMIQLELKEALHVAQQKLDTDIYIIPVRLDKVKVPDSLSKYHWVDLSTKNGFSNLLKAIRIQVDKLGLFQKMSLRSKPIENLSGTAITKMMKEKQFYDEHHFWNAPGIRHQYESVRAKKSKLVIDHSTNLCWQQSGSLKSITYVQALGYIKKLNKEKHGGISNWRLPTLEEGMSLMETKRTDNGLYINGIFDKVQTQIWTADGYLHRSTGKQFAWMVHFFSGWTALNDLSRDEYVRAVSTFQE